MTPAESDLVAPRDALDFFEARSIDLPRPMSALEAWDALMRYPLPGIALAFRIRDAISARFGIKRIGGATMRRPTAPKVGDRLGFFLIERIEPAILTLSERDRHLDNVTCVTTHDLRLTITTSVKVHNLYGRIYMLPVAPAHRLIVSTMLRRLARSLKD